MGLASGLIQQFILLLDIENVCLILYYFTTANEPEITP